MEITIHNIAVISVPRTASKFLTKWYADKLQKIPAYGVLHKPEYLGKNEYNVREIVFGYKHVLHGHWHSLNLLDDDILLCLKQNYKIVTIYRDINKVQSSIETITGRDDLFKELIKKSEKEKLNWNIDEHYVIEGDNVCKVLSIPPNCNLV